MVEGETLTQGYCPALRSHFASFDVFLDVIHHHNTYIKYTCIRDLLSLVLRLNPSRQGAVSTLQQASA